MKTFLILCVLTLAGLGAQGEVSSAAARGLLTAHQDALIIVEGVLKVETLMDGTRQGREREIPVMASGFLVDTSGLALVSSYHLNPFGIMAAKPIRMEHGGRSLEFQMRTKLESLRMRMRNRLEMPARIQLEDADLGLTLLSPEPKTTEERPVFRSVPLEPAAAAVPYAPYLILDQGEGSFRNELVLESGVISGVLAKPRNWCLQDLGRPWMFIGAPFFDLDGRLLGMGLLHVRPPQDPAAGTWDSQPVPVIVATEDIRAMVSRALKPEETAKAASLMPASAARLASLPASQALAILGAASNAVVVVEGSVRYKCGRCTEEHEGEVETVGTMLDPAGLVVVTNEGDSQGNQYLEQRLRCVLPNGSEVPMEIVLHDDDLLLTVLAPARQEGASAPPSGFPVLSLDPETKAELLDDVLTLGRLGKENRYAVTAAPGHITSRATQPRLFYQLYSLPPSLSDEGLPVLTAAGALLGLTASDPQSGRPGPEDIEEAPPTALRRNPVRIVPPLALRELLEHARQARSHAEPAAQE